MKLFLLSYLGFSLVFIFFNYRFWKLQKARDEHMQKIFFEREIHGNG
jgi:hypothetical protein